MTSAARHAARTEVGAVTISVLMPVLDAARYLADALSSVLPQLGPDDEIVVQDGGSTDGTREVVRAFDDPRVKWHSEPDSGQTQALARALERSTGDYIGWLNGDDRYEPAAIGALRAAIERALDDGDRPTMVYGNFGVTDPDGNSYRSLTPRAVTAEGLFARGCYVFSGAVLLRRDALVAAGFDERYHYSMDFDLFIRVAMQPDFDALHVPVLVGQLRLHGDSKTGTTYLAFIREAYAIRRNVHRTGLGTRWQLWVGTVTFAVGVLTTRLRYTRLYTRLRREHPVG